MHAFTKFQYIQALFGGNSPEAAMLLSLKWIMISMKTLNDRGMQDENEKIAENKSQTSAGAATTGPARHSAAQKLSLNLKSLISSYDDECTDVNFFEAQRELPGKQGGQVSQ